MNKKYSFFFFSGMNKLLTAPNVVHTTNLHPDGEYCYLYFKPSLGKEVHTYTYINSFTIEPRLWADPSAVAYLVGPRYLSVLRNVQTYCGTHPTSCSVETGKSFLGYSDWGVKLLSHIHLVPWLRLHGAVTLYAFIVRAWTTLRSPQLNILGQYWPKLYYLDNHTVRIQFLDLQCNFILGWTYSFESHGQAVFPYLSLLAKRTSTLHLSYHMF